MLTIAPGGSHVVETTLEVLKSLEGVKAVEAEVKALQAKGAPTVHPTPVEPFAPPRAERVRRRGLVGMVVVLVAALSVGLNAGFLHEAAPVRRRRAIRCLRLSLVRGDGYREIDRPDAPRHGHFPPGYPLALAGLAGR